MMSDEEEITYEKGLPACELGSDDLRELKKVLEQSSGQLQDMTFEVKFAGFSKRYKNLRKLLDDPLKPDTVGEFRLEVKFDRGVIQIYSCPLYGRLTIVGEEKWVRIKAQELTDFFNRRKSLLRMFSKSLPAIVLLCAAIFFGGIPLARLFEEHLRTLIVLSVGILSLGIMFTLFFLHDKTPYILLVFRKKKSPVISFLKWIIGIIVGSLVSYLIYILIL